jgi:hypothetical protein
MKTDEPDALEIASKCRQPDPLTCYEEVTRCEGSLFSDDAQPAACLHCPVASWPSAMVFSGDGVQWCLGRRRHLLLATFQGLSYSLSAVRVGWVAAFT